MFPFPSNGKAYINSENTTVRSIVLQGFHSLQTGKHISTGKFFKAMFGGIVEFPFPSNGKAYINYQREVAAENLIEEFPFPSNGKAYINSEHGVRCKEND